MTPGFIKTGIKRFFFKHGYDCVITKRIDAGGTHGEVTRLINIGAGDWECPGWTNLDHSSGTYAVEQSRHSFVEYDIRKDNLPYEDNSVDAIFCSHVIEHIETNHVKHMLKECYRVLKPGAVVRVTCPDAEWLYKVTKAGNRDFWIRRSAELKRYGVDFDNWDLVNFLVREVAAPRTHGFGYKDDPNFDYKTPFREMEKEMFFDYVTDGLEFVENSVGSHINWWSVRKLSKAFQESGFVNIIESRCGGSVSKYMISRAYFDTSGPWCSLYVEAVK